MSEDAQDIVEVPTIPTVEVSPDAVISPNQVTKEKEEELPQVTMGLLTIDPEFPFGKPENINLAEVDPMGHPLLKEVNLRPWMKSTEYHGGDPLDEIDVYQAINRLDRKYVRGVIPDVQFRRAKAQLREEGINRFFLNVNVYNLVPFTKWIKNVSVALISIVGSTYNPLVVRMNPLRPTLNFSMYWDYWTIEEKLMIHSLFVETLQQIPV